MRVLKIALTPVILTILALLVGVFLIVLAPVWGIVGTIFMFKKKKEGSESMDLMDMIDPDRRQRWWRDHNKLYGDTAPTEDEDE